MKKILFVSWDGYHTTYAEGLFMPIFHKITELSNGEYEFHYLQFSNAGKERVDITRAAAEKHNIKYEHSYINKYLPISTHFHLSAFINLFNGHKVIKKIIKENDIDIIMPRSVFPAYMVNKLAYLNKTTIYDADGFSVEERVDFKGLKRNGLRYRLSSLAEKKILENCSHIITRSNKAIEIHLARNPLLKKEKFTAVYNGRDADFFKPMHNEKQTIREKLGVKENELLLVYSGSLGNQYGWEEMVEIVQKVASKTPVKWLILTVSKEFVEENLPTDFQNIAIVKRVNFTKMPLYLNAADVAFAIRKPSFSMQGVCPIKLGEYLLLGLPTVASLGIGDTEVMLSENPSCFLFDHDETGNVDEAVDWILKNKRISEEQKLKIRNCGMKFFNLDDTANKYIQILDQATDI